MANRRFAVHEIRHVIARMRLGESDRQIAKAGLMGRVKAGKLRLLAQDQGWLTKEKGLDMEPTGLRLSLLPDAYKGRSRFCRDTRNMLQ